MSLFKKINSKSARVTIVGLGYVGIPLLNSLINAGFYVTGIDIDSEKIRKIRQGIYEEPFITEESISKALFTTDFTKLQESEIDIICVPTPLTGDSIPDISYVKDAVEEVAKNMKKEKMVIVESTIYSGALREAVFPVFYNKGFVHDKDYYLAYVPERIDPGNNTYGVLNTPRVVGGMSKKASDLAGRFYRNIVKEVIEVSSPEVAEMTKLLENSFRCINIAFINELENSCRELNINVYEVIKAASTKPFGYMPFYPGPGIGGHCITTDPLFLTWKSRNQGTPCCLLEKAVSLNRERPGQVTRLICEILEKRRDIKGSKVMLFGVTYKKNVADLRESPALKIFEFLLEKEIDVKFFDPFVQGVIVKGQKYIRTPLYESILKEMDCVVITTDHDGVDYDLIKKQSSILLDTRGIYSN